MSTGFELSKDDKGHRLGNFHNYYTFNPTKNRLEVMEACGILDRISQLLIPNQQRTGKRQKINEDNSNSNDREETVLLYCDLGCNEGDLTLEMANEIVTRMKQKDLVVKLKCLGLDIDPQLIHRANQKQKRHESSSSSSNVSVVFQQCNICDEQTYRTKCGSFLGNHRTASSNDDENTKRPSDHPKFDLISIFSTTMWIHIHSGDEGLRQFLQRTCEMTNAILIEPQPSKCYRSVNVRLRKMNCDEVDDISCSRLRMRANIETEIEKVICSCGFRRVSIHDDDDDDDSSVAVPKQDEDHSDEKRNESITKDRTSWKRILQLYVRVT